MAKKATKQAKKEVLSPAAQKLIRIEQAKSEAINTAKLALQAIPKPTQICKANPSAIKTLRMCPSFYPAFEEEDDRDAANEGTLLHEACRTGDLKKLDATQKPLVEMALKYLASIRVAGDKRLSERKVNVAQISNGFIDELVISKDGRSCHVVDWKFGFVPVDDAEKNDQGKCYVIGVLELFPTIDSVTVHFVQPKLDSITLHTFYRRDVAALRADVVSVYLQTKLPPAKRPHRVVPQACAYCGRITVCPAVMKLFAETMPLAVPELTKKEMQELITTDPETITDGARAEKLFVASRVLNTLCKTIKEQCTQYLLAGYEMETVKLRQRDGSLSITGRPNEIYKVIKQHFPECTEEMFYTMCNAPNKTNMDAFLDDLALNTKGKGTRPAVIDALATSGFFSRGNPSFFAQLA